MLQVKESVGNLIKSKKLRALWSKGAKKLGEVAKCVAGAKSLRTTRLINFKKVNNNVIMCLRQIAI